MHLIIFNRARQRHNPVSVSLARQVATCQNGAFRAIERRSLLQRTLLMAACVLAYSGGLDTSVILGWLMDEGYDVHAVYVDLGQPCEDREAILQKARNIGAKSARIVDARGAVSRLSPFPSCNGTPSMRACTCWARRSPVP